MENGIWRALSYHNFVDFEFVKEFINKNWDWIILYKRLNLDIDFILKHIPPQQWGYFSQNITFDFIKNNPDLLWDSKHLSLNPNITIDIIRSKTFKLDWTNLSKNKKITLDIIKKNMDLPWNWNEITVRSSLEDIYLNEDLPWNYEKINICSAI